ncbi:hypothetical protein J4Q44_G00239950 [Coregonus suidteri]|uniref:Uncharacterized protein n=1 Tax=Coregonus suidteri TaxID=861788 RepID=A0AAN8LEY3_9TELE
MEHFWDLLFQLMKHGTNTLHVAFIFLFSVDIDAKVKLLFFFFKVLLVDYIQKCVLQPQKVKLFVRMRGNILLALVRTIAFCRKTIPVVSESLLSATMLAVNLPAVIVLQNYS